MRSPGVLSDPSDLFGAYIYISQSVQRWNFALIDFVATKADEGTSSQMAQSSIKESYIINGSGKRTL